MRSTGRWQAEVRLQPRQTFRLCASRNRADRHAGWLSIGLRPPRTAGFEVRFETPPGQQAQVDFAHFEVEFADEPGVKRIVWLFSMVFGYSRLIWARFVL